MKIFPRSNFLGGNYPGGKFPGGNFPSGSFPRWELSRWHFSTWEFSWVGIFFGGSFLGGNCLVGIIRVAIFPVGVFMLPILSWKETVKIILRITAGDTKHTKHFMWRKFRFRFSWKINWTLGKMSDKKSLSIQGEEILMEQISNYPCLYDKSESRTRNGRQ